MIASLGEKWRKQHWRTAQGRRNRVGCHHGGGQTHESLMCEREGRSPTRKLGASSAAMWCRSCVKERGGRQQESLGRRVQQCGLQTQRSWMRINGVVTTCTQARRDGHRFWRKKATIQRRIWPSSHSSNIHGPQYISVVFSAMEAAG